MIGFVKTSLQSIKDLCQLDFFTKSLTFCFVLIYWLCWAESTASTAALQQKRSDILVLLWQKCQIFKVNYLWLKKFDTKINAILLISELMASVRKVLRHFYPHGEIFITASITVKIRCPCHNTKHSGLIRFCWMYGLAVMLSIPRFHYQ